MERTETQMKILEVGKKEFLEKGFKDASLNKIVEGRLLRLLPG